MTGIQIFYEGNLSTRCVHEDNGQVILTDAPKDNQGLGRMFSPTDLLAAALGSCVLTLMGIAANRLKVDIKGTQLFVTKEMSTTPPRRIAKLTLTITSPHVFDAHITQQLEQAGSKCPVHASLHPDTIQEFHFTWGTP